MQADEAPLEASETQDAIDVLNDYMASLEVRGVVLGYTPVTGVSDFVTIPDGAVQGVVDNLAILCAPDFDGTVSEALVASASIGMDALRRLGRTEMVTQYPRTLPRGQGHYLRHYDHSPMFEGSYRAFSRLVESFGTEFSALDTPKRILAEWEPQYSEGYSAWVSGRIQNTTNQNITSAVKAEISATGDGTYTLHIVKSGVSQVSSSHALTSSATAIALTTTLTIEPGEWVEIWAEADTDLNDLNLTLGEFRVE